MIVNYNSIFLVVRLLRNMTATKISNHFTSMLDEYGLPSIIVADSGSQYFSEEFKKKCEQSNVTILFSSPYHHQAKVWLKTVLVYVSPCGRRQLKANSVHIQPCGRTELTLLTVS